MKAKELAVKILKNKIGRIVCLIIAALIVVSVIVLVSYTPEETLNTDFIIAKLEKASELTTAKLTYKGVSEFEDKGVAFINKSDFIMVYEAQGKAGIDVKKIEVTADEINHVVRIKLPKAEIFDVKVEMDSIKYFDEKFALFNVNSKEDANEAVKLAEEEGEKELKEMGILEMADKQAEALVKGLIEDVVPYNYKIKIN